jgi:hypothetical protein
LVNTKLKPIGVVVLSLWILLVSCSGPVAEAYKNDETIPAPVENDAKIMVPTQKPTLAVQAKAGSCPVTKPAWVKPPEDPAVDGSPGYGYYYVNEDSSIWASAWWNEAKEYQLRASKEGVKLGWFRPEGATLEITGQRLDGQAPPLDAHIPCCYPTRFQATGLAFPTEGCWQVTAKADDSVLSFVVEVEP